MEGDSGKSAGTALLGLLTVPDELSTPNHVYLYIPTPGSSPATDRVARATSLRDDCRDWVRFATRAEYLEGYGSLSFPGC
jgi:hypothetical protein